MVGQPWGKGEAVGQSLEQLVRCAVHPLSLLSIAVLIAFSTGYSIFIGEMTQGGGADAAMRFQALNLLFGALSSLLSALMLLALSRRLGSDDLDLPLPRLGAFFGVVFGFFLLQRAVQMIWPLILFSAFDVGDWFLTALRVPGLVLQIVLFPLVVWQVALARGVETVGPGQIWSHVWRRQAWAPALVGVIGIFGLILLDMSQPLLTETSDWPRSLSLAVYLGPSALAAVLFMLLAIISYAEIERWDGEREGDVFV